MTGAINQYMNEDASSLHKWQLDMKDELENFKLLLMGYEVNQDYQKEGDPLYIMTNKVPFCNELGAIQIKNRLMAMVNKAASDTNLSQEKINNELKEFDISVSSWLAMSYKSFEIRPKDYDSVCEMMVEWAINIMHRSIKGWKGGLINAPGNVKEVYYPGPSAENTAQPKSRLGFFGR